MNHKNNNNHSGAFLWSPESWKLFPVSQIPEYQDQLLYHGILQDIKQLCPIIVQEEIQAFNQELLKVCQGNRFIIQIGDCSEVFDECTETNWLDKFTFFQSLAKLFQTKTSISPLIIGRVCGQFSKPRSVAYECDGTLTYRGDLINSIDQSNRKPDPIRLLKGAMLQQSGIELLRRFQNKINDKPETNGCQSNGLQKTHREFSQIYVSHECLHLPYESAFCKKSSSGFYQSNAHFLWVGERTKKPTEGHVHYLSGIENAIGFKVGGSIEQEDFLQINKILNPKKIAGKLFAILRLGVKNIREVLPKIIEWKKKFSLEFGWICDPMHGNTYSLNGYKVRYMSDIKEELESFVEIMIKAKQQISGVHFEVTPYNVTECLDSREDEASSANFSNYRSTCDPRVNYKQSFQLIEFVADLLSQKNCL